MPKAWRSAPATQLATARTLTDFLNALGGGAVHITPGGYEFLLKDTSLQVRWVTDERR